jgi:hypothetical protein
MKRFVLYIDKKQQLIDLVNWCNENIGAQGSAWWHQRGHHDGNFESSIELWIDTVDEDIITIFALIWGKYSKCEV